MDGKISKPAVKGLQGFLADDMSLTERVTHEQFLEKKTAPNNSDDELGEVYKVYRAAVEKYSKS